MHEGDVVAERFVVEQLAGSGGMGSVYRAHDRVTGETVALKVIRVAADTEEYCARLSREGEALARLKHPHIVRYIAHGVLPTGAPYVALEWIGGDTLGRRLSQKGLTLTETIDVLAQVADALGFAHVHGIVHRDVKPGNVMLREEGLNAVLLDFGVARVSVDAGELTRTGMLVGTPLYMAPEQARGARDLDARADVFALGCLTFKCLTGKAAFAADDVLAVLAKVLLDNAPRLRDVRPSLPAELDVVVAKMLERDRDRRYPDGNAVALALRSLGDLTDEIGGSNTIALAAPSSPSLTRGEQRLMSLVVAGSLDPRVADERVTLVREAIADLGARCEALANGSIVVACEGAASATDLVAGAARAALRVRRVLSDAPIVVVTGRGSSMSSRTGAENTSLGGGDIFNRASQTLRKLSESDSPQRILLDEATARLLDPRFEVVASASGPELRAEMALAEPVRTLLGKATTCVGRERELALLAATLDECATDSVARAVVVTAPSGGGKSRLRFELLQRARQMYPDALVLMGRGDPLLTTGPYAILAQAVRRAATIKEGEPALVRSDKLTELVAKHVASAECERVTMFLGELVGVPSTRVNDAMLESARRDPTLMATRTRRAFEDWLDAEATARPVLLILDDLQWGDAATVRLVDTTMTKLADRSLFVLALGRPELHANHPNLWADRNAQPLPLGPLSRKASEKLAREVLADKATDAIVERVARLAGGNAFYLEELLRSAAAGESEVPESVRAMVQTRLEALEPEARRVLRAASIYGDAFWPGSVRALLGEASIAVEPWLTALTLREILAARDDSRFPAEREHTFRHAMFRETAYSMLTEDDQKLGHRLAAMWLVSAGEHDPLVVAKHFEQGDDPALASPWLVRAAEAAFEKNEFALVFALARRADAAGIGGEQRGEMLLHEGQAHRWRGETDIAQTCARAAIELLEPHGDGWVSAVSLLATTSGYRGDFPELERSAVLLLAHATRQDDTTRRRTAIAVAETTGSLFVSGRQALALELLEAAEASAAPIFDHDPLVASRIYAARRARSSLEDNPQEVLELTVACRDAALLAGDARTVCVAGVNIGYTLGLLGRWDEAEPVLREVFDQAALAGFATTVMHAKQNLGYVLLRLGKLDEAEALQREACVEATKQNALRFLVSSHTCLSGIALARGDATTAVSEARLAVAATKPSTPSAIYVLAILADALLAQGEVEEAAEAASRALAQLEESGAFDVSSALVRAVNIETLLRVGRSQEALALLQGAHLALMARAQRVPDGPWRTRFLNDVPEHARVQRLMALHGHMS